MNENKEYHKNVLKKLIKGIIDETIKQYENDILINEDIELSDYKWEDEDLYNIRNNI